MSRRVLTGCSHPFVFSTLLTPLGGALFCGTRTVSSEIIQSALERACCGSELNWIIRTVASNALAALVTSLALEITFTFTAGIVFTLQTLATAFLVGCVIAVPLLLIAVIAGLAFILLTLLQRAPI